MLVLNVRKALEVAEEMGFLNIVQMLKDKDKPVIDIKNRNFIVVCDVLLFPHRTNPFQNFL